eukprot:1159126-Pelagomonas_calceolata.AAC.16
MEQQLDEVSEGSVPWKSVLKDFWGPFQKKCESLKDLKVSEVVDALNEVSRCDSEHGSDLIVDVQNC